MSRLTIKNLPKYATPESLKSHFSQAAGPGGILTDVKVPLKSDGTPRGFGFIGYKTEEEASKALEWFDKTFIGSSRIRVMVSEGSGTKHAPEPRPNKRRRPDTDGAEGNGDGVVDFKKTRLQDESKSKSKEQKKEKSKKETQMGEFLEVMQTRKGPSWANQPQPEASTSATRVEDVPMEVENENVEGLSDLDWMRKHMSKNVDVVEKVFEQSDDEGGHENEEPEDKADQDQDREPDDPIKTTILQTGRLFLRNLAFSCTKEDLEVYFGRFGNVSQVHIPVDPSTQQSKGLAYVTFANPDDAVGAYQTLDKKSFQGRLLHILGAVDRKGNTSVEDVGGKKRTVKQEKDKKRKDMAGREFNWGMLYMNSDAVASSIADRMAIPKSAILNPDSDSVDASVNPAVKLALAETHIINETKTYLESHGVVLSSFSSLTSSRTRSPTTILVKNIPYGTSESQIREIFEPHGILNRVLIPPAGTIAVVEFQKADEAGKAFKAVAYRRLGNAVIYLEKAPEGIFEAEKAVDEKEMKELAWKHAVKLPEQTEEGKSSEEVALGAGTTLYVKNLAFSTTTQRLIQVFSHMPGFAFARVQMKSGADGKQLSCGYGFVGFKDKENAKKAMDSIQDFVLDGHALRVSFAGRGREEEETKAGGVGSKSRTTKITVKNVPFEVKKKDIKDLFSPHGTVKSVRLPRNFSDKSRGYAFVEFTTRNEAETAFEALKHSHLLGRHLVLEWAKDDGMDIDELRKKTGVGYGGGTSLPGKKKKLDMELGGGADAEEDSD